MFREDLLKECYERCMKELYTYAQPSVEWDDFIQQNKEYNEKYKQWENYRVSKRLNDKVWEEWQQIHPDWEEKTVSECIGPRPYEFYYLPEDVMKEICDSYISAYELDKQKDLIDIKDTLIGYCEKPIRKKNIKGYRGYEHPDSLETVLCKELGDDELGKKAWEKMKEYLNMATDFYSWNSELNCFKTNVYLGASPNSNKDAVIENWKKYRDKDIKIDEEKYKNFEDEYYGF